jgi:hypothetical protein
MSTAASEQSMRSRHFGRSPALRFAADAQIVEVDHLADIREAEADALARA